MHRTLAALILLACLPTLALADGDTPKPPPAPIQFAIKRTPQGLSIEGTSTLPHGVQLWSSLVLGERPLGWRSTYVLNGKFRVRLPQTRLKPGKYVVQVVFRKLDQIKDLQPKVASQPARLVRELPYDVGTPRQAAEARQAELKLLTARQAELAQQLAALKTLETGDKPKPGDTTQLRARLLAFDRWIAVAARLERTLQTQRRAGSYHNGELAQLANLANKAGRWAKAIIRVELEKASQRVPRRFAPVSEMANKPSQLGGYVTDEMKKMTARLAELTKAVEAELAALARPKDADK